jgi:hypothetical protein
MLSIRHQLISGSSATWILAGIQSKKNFEEASFIKFIDLK